MDYYSAGSQAYDVPRSRGERFKDYFVNDGSKFVLIVIWVLGNIVAFADRWYEYCMR
jgi:hypothetical protein